MDYFGIIKKAYEITIKHKFLWIFGILAGGYGGFRGFSSSINYSDTGSGFEKGLNSLTNQSWQTFWGIWGGLIIGGLVALGLLAIAFFVLNIISQGALVSGAEKLSKKEKADFHSAFSVGWRNFWRVWGMAILYLLMILASLIVWIVPAAVAFVTGAIAVGIIWAALFFFVDLAFWILIGLISPYSLRIIVLKKMGVWESIRESLHFFRDHWVQVVLMYLLLFAFGMAYGLAFLLAILITGSILLAIGYGLFLASIVAAIIYGLVVGLALVVTLIIIGGVYNTFYSTTLTLTYLELKGKD